MRNGGPVILLVASADIAMLVLMASCTNLYSFEISKSSLCVSCHNPINKKDIRLLVVALTNSSTLTQCDVYKQRKNSDDAFKP